MRPFSEYLKHNTLTILSTIFLLFLCLMPASEFRGRVEISDKLVHFLMFLGITLVTWGEYTFHQIYRKREMKIKWKLQVLYPLLLGALTELMQHYASSSRSGDFYDFLADVVGVLVATLIGYISCYYIKKNVQNKSI